MKYAKQHGLLFFLVVLILQSCKVNEISSDFSSEPGESNYIAQPYDADPDYFPNSMPSANADLLAIQQKNGSFFFFASQFPSEITGEKVPLIISLHGAGGEAESHLEFVAKPIIGDYKAIILAPNKSSNLNWTHGSLVQPILSTIELAKQKWPIDESKIIIMGYSIGGTAVWHFTNDHPEIFSAGLVLAGSPNINERSGQVPLFLVHGTEDTYFGYQNVVDAYNSLRERGAIAELKIGQGLAHYPVEPYFSLMESFITWLEEVVWQQ